MTEKSKKNRIDTIRPDAPELAFFGPFAVGVRTTTFTNPGQLDIAAAEHEKPAPVYDRQLTAEIWYPALADPSRADLGLADLGRAEIGEYKDVVTRDGSMKVSLYGRAARDARPDTSAGPCPLVILSHGYPGNRFIMAHFGENLASKGYVVVSIDHADSTYDDLGAFSSTLFNRSLDQLFILNSMAELDRDEDCSDLAGMIDSENMAIIGYSMGGYGAINTVGGGFASAIVKSSLAPPDMLLSKRQAGNPEYAATIDPRIKAAIVIAPWGWPKGFWDKSGLAGIKTPLFFMAGSGDTTVGYSPGVRNIFENCVNAERYLLTFENAGHNAIAPIQAPEEVCLESGSGRQVLETLRRPGLGWRQGEQYRPAFCHRLSGKISEKR